MPYFHSTLTFEAPDEEHAKAWLDGIAKQIGDTASYTEPRGEDDKPPAVIYTDGGCIKAGDRGAWAFVITREGFPDVEAFGTDPETTNNRMEMEAVLRAMEHMEIGPAFTIMSDSQYVIKGLTEWSRNWVRNGWKTRDNQPVANADLWQQMLPLYQVHNVKFVHVKGHTGIVGNERCDALCTEAMEVMHKDILTKATIEEALADKPEGDVF